jgi:predicted transcriptional regulator
MKSALSETAGLFQALSEALPHIINAAIDFIIIIQHIDLIKFHRRVTWIDSRSEATHACVNGQQYK